MTYLPSRPAFAIYLIHPSTTALMLAGLLDDCAAVAAADASQQLRHPHPRGPRHDPALGLLLGPDVAGARCAPRRAESSGIF